jgi:PAS domain S-box-containing protein
MAHFVQNLLRLNSIKGNIILAMLAMGFFTLLAVGTTYWLTGKAEEANQQITEILQPAKGALEVSKTDINSATLALSAYLETGKDLHRNNWEEIWEEQQAEYKAITAVSLNQTVSSQQVQLIDQHLQRLQASQAQLVKNIKQAYLRRDERSAEENYGADADIRQPYRNQLTGELLPLLKDTENSLTQVEAGINRQIEKLYIQREGYLYWMKISSLLILVLCILTAIAISYTVSGQIMRSLYYIKKAVKDLSQGNLPASIHQSKNETSYITLELGKLTANLRNVQEFALRVGEGQFDNQISVFNNSGELGTSLAGMRDSLSRVALEDQQRNWVNEGFARFGDILRTHNSSISELCDVTISSLVKYTGANQGAIFLISNGEAQSGEVLKMVSCYAYDRKKFQEKEILKGEGLCGQAWQENDVILINDIPDDFINIRSGLGGANPKAALVVPLTVNEQMVGVLELASFEQFEPHQVDFIRKIAENMASAISTAKNNEKTQRLLEEFQAMTEQMRAQEEEMRQNMEELKSTQEEMERAQKEIIRKEYNLNGVINNTSDTIFAIDRDYRITVVNKVLSDKYQKMGIILEEGTRISDVLPRSAWDKWKVRYDRALAGERYSLIEESSGSEGTRFSQTYHNPIWDSAGSVIGVSVVSRDVTDTVTAQKEAERKRSTINSLINNTDDTYFAIDTEYRILIANKTLRDRFAASNITLEEGDNIFDKLPKEQHPQWKERYDRALSGESFVLTNERPVGDKVLLIEVHHHPIVDAAGTIIGATVISKDITRWKEALAEKEQQQQELEKLQKLMGLEKTPEEQLLKQAQDEKKAKKSS